MIFSKYRVLCVTLVVFLNACGGSDDIETNPRFRPPNSGGAALPGSDESSGVSTASNMTITSAPVTPLPNTEVSAPLPNGTGGATINNPEAKPGGKLVLRIAGTVAGIDHDVLEVAGTAELAGALALEFSSAYFPVKGQSFTIVNAAEIVGGFSSLTSNRNVNLSVAQGINYLAVTVD